MRKLLFYLLISFGILFYEAGLFSQEKPEGIAYDYIIVVDTSGSMEGKPPGSGSRVIFPDVKRNIVGFIENYINPGMNIVIIPFSGKVVESQIFSRIPVKDKNDIDELRKYINSIQAKGEVTWLYHAIQTALNWSTKLEKEIPGRKHVQSIYVYTDGLNNGPDNLTLQQILNQFTMRRGEIEHLFLRLMTINVQLPPEVKKPSEAAGVGITETDKPPPIQGIVKIEPPELNLQNLYVSKGKGVAKISFTSSITNIVGKPIKVNQEFPQGVESDISPKELRVSSEPQEIRFELLKEVKEGQYEGKLVFSPSKVEDFIVDNRKVPLKFEYRKPAAPATITLTFPKALSFEVPHKGGSRVEKIQVSFNETAKNEDKKIQLEIKDVGDGSNIKIPEHFYLTSNRVTTKSRKITVDKDTKEILIHIEIPKAEVSSVKADKFKGKLIYHPEEGVDVKIERGGAKTGFLFIPSAFAEEKLIDIPITIKIKPNPLPYFVIAGIGAIILMFIVFLLGRKIGWWQSYGKMMLVDETGMTIKLRDKQIKNRLYSPKLTIGSRKQNVDIGASGLMGVLYLKGGRCFITSNKKGTIKVDENEIEKPTKLIDRAVIEISNKKLTFKTK